MSVINEQHIESKQMIDSQFVQYYEDYFKHDYDDTEAVVVNKVGNVYTYFAPQLNVYKKDFADIDSLITYITTQYDILCDDRAIIKYLISNKDVNKLKSGNTNEIVIHIDVKNN